MGAWKRFFSSTRFLLHRLRCSAPFVLFFLTFFLPISVFAINVAVSPVADVPAVPAKPEPIPVNNFPVLDKVISGEFSIETPTPTSMIMHQRTQDVVVDFNSYNIGAGNRVDLFQPTRDSNAIFRVNGASGISTIDGCFTATGNVFLLNPNGILIGKNGVLDMNAFIASTHDDFTYGIDGMGQRFLQLTGVSNPDAEIRNYGTIRVGDSGVAVFASPITRNYGGIFGRAAFVAGEKTTLTLDGSDIVRFEVEGKLKRAIIEQQGHISAKGKEVVLRTADAEHFMDTNMINMDGEMVGAKITAIGGEGSQVVLGSKSKLDATGDHGGFIKVLGDDVYAKEGATLDASGDFGGGKIWLGGGPEGHGAEKNAQTLFVDDNVTMKADSRISGKAGEIINYADTTAVLWGYASAQALGETGEAGFIEYSGKQFLTFAKDLAHMPRLGKGGMFLIDPSTVNIINSADLGLAYDGANPATNTVSNAWIQNALGGGGLTITATNSITVGGDIVLPNTNPLTLKVTGAGGTITVNNRIYNSANSFVTLTFDAPILNFTMNANQIWGGNLTAELLSSTTGSLTVSSAAVAEPWLPNRLRVSATSVAFNSNFNVNSAVDIVANTVTGGGYTLNSFGRNISWGYYYEGGAAILAQNFVFNGILAVNTGSGNTTFNNVSAQAVSAFTSTGGTFTVDNTSLYTGAGVFTTGAVTITASPVISGDLDIKNIQGLLMSVFLENGQNITVLNPSKSVLINSPINAPTQSRILNFGTSSSTLGGLVVNQDVKVLAGTINVDANSVSGSGSKTLQGKTINFGVSAAPPSGITNGINLAGLNLTAQTLTIGSVSQIVGLYGGSVTAKTLTIGPNIINASGQTLTLQYDQTLDGEPSVPGNFNVSGNFAGTLTIKSLDSTKPVQLFGTINANLLSLSYITGIGALSLNTDPSYTSAAINFDTLVNFELGALTIGGGSVSFYGNGTNRLSPTALYLKTMVNSSYPLSLLGSNIHFYDTTGFTMSSQQLTLGPNSPSQGTITSHRTTPLTLPVNTLIQNSRLALDDPATNSFVVRSSYMNPGVWTFNSIHLMDNFYVDTTEASINLSLGALTLDATTRTSGFNVSGGYSFYLKMMGEVTKNGSSYPVSFIMPNTNPSYNASLFVENLDMSAINTVSLPAFSYDSSVPNTSQNFTYDSPSGSLSMGSGTDTTMAGALKLNASTINTGSSARITAKTIAISGGTFTSTYPPNLFVTGDNSTTGFTFTSTTTGGINIQSNNGAPVTIGPASAPSISMGSAAQSVQVTNTQGTTTLRNVTMAGDFTVNPGAQTGAIILGSDVVFNKMASFYGASLTLSTAASVGPVYAYPLAFDPSVSFSQIQADTLSIYAPITSSNNVLLASPNPLTIGKSVTINGGNSLLLKSSSITTSGALQAQALYMTGFDDNSTTPTGAGTVLTMNEGTSVTATSISVNASSIGGTGATFSGSLGFAKTPYIKGGAVVSINSANPAGALSFPTAVASHIAGEGNNTITIGGHLPAGLGSFVLDPGPNAQVTLISTLKKSDGTGLDFDVSLKSGGFLNTSLVTTGNILINSTTGTIIPQGGISSLTGANIIFDASTSSQSSGDLFVDGNTAFTITSGQPLIVRNYDIANKRITFRNSSMSGTYQFESPATVHNVTFTPTAASTFTDLRVANGAAAGTLTLNNFSTVSTQLQRLYSGHNDSTLVLNYLAGITQFDLRKIVGPHIAGSGITNTFKTITVAVAGALPDAPSLVQPPSVGQTIYVLPTAVGGTLTLTSITNLTDLSIDYPGATISLYGASPWTMNSFRLNQYTTVNTPSFSLPAGGVLRADGGVALGPNGATGSGVITTLNAGSQILSSTSISLGAMRFVGGAASSVSFGTGAFTWSQDNQNPGNIQSFAITDVAGTGSANSITITSAGGILNTTNFSAKSSGALDINMPIQTYTAGNTGTFLFQTTGGVGPFKIQGDLGGDGTSAANQPKFVTFSPYAYNEDDVIGGSVRATDTVTLAYGNATSLTPMTFDKEWVSKSISIDTSHIPVIFNALGTEASPITTLTAKSAANITFNGAIFANNMYVTGGDNTSTIALNGAMQVGSLYINSTTDAVPVVQYYQGVATVPSITVAGAIDGLGAANPTVVLYGNNIAVNAGMGGTTALKEFNAVASGVLSVTDADIKATSGNISLAAGGAITTTSTTGNNVFSTTGQILFNAGAASTVAHILDVGTLDLTNLTFPLTLSGSRIGKTTEGDRGALTLTGATAAISLENQQILFDTITLSGSSDITLGAVGGTVSANTIQLDTTNIASSQTFTLRDVAAKTLSINTGDGLATNQVSVQLPGTVTLTGTGADNETVAQIFAKTVSLTGTFSAVGKNVSMTTSDVLTFTPTALQAGVVTLQGSGLVLGGSIGTEGASITSLTGTATAGNIAQTGNIYVAGAVGLTANAGTVSFAPTVFQAGAVTLSGTGLTLGGTIGSGANPIASLTGTATAGTISQTGNLYVTGAVGLTSTSSTVTFNPTALQAGAVTLSGTGLTLGGTIGSGANPIASLTGTATAGTISQTGSLYVAGAVGLTANAGTVSFTPTVLQAGAITLSGTGLTLDGAIGSVASPVPSFTGTATAGTISQTGSLYVINAIGLTSTGVLTLNPTNLQGGAVTLQGSGLVLGGSIGAEGSSITSLTGTATAGDIAQTGNIYVAGAVGLTANAGTVSFTPTALQAGAITLSGTGLTLDGDIGSVASPVPSFTGTATAGNIAQTGSLYMTGELNLAASGDISLQAAYAPSVVLNTTRTAAGVAQTFSLYDVTTGSLDINQGAGGIYVDQTTIKFLGNIIGTGEGLGYVAPVLTITGQELDLAGDIGTLANPIHTLTATVSTIDLSADAKIHANQPLTLTATSLLTNGHTLTLTQDSTLTIGDIRGIVDATGHALTVGPLAGGVGNLSASLTAETINLQSSFNLVGDTVFSANALTRNNTGYRLYGTTSSPYRSLTLTLPTQNFVGEDNKLSDWIANQFNNLTLSLLNLDVNNAGGTFQVHGVLSLDVGGQDVVVDGGIKKISSMNAANSITFHDPVILLNEGGATLTAGGSIIFNQGFSLESDAAVQAEGVVTVLGPVSGTGNLSVRAGVNRAANQILTLQEAIGASAPLDGTLSLTAGTVVLTKDLHATSDITFDADQLILTGDGATRIIDSVGGVVSSNPEMRFDNDAGKDMILKLTSATPFNIQHFNSETLKEIHATNGFLLQGAVDAEARGTPLLLVGDLVVDKTGGGDHPTYTIGADLSVTGQFYTTTEGVNLTINTGANVLDIQGTIDHRDPKYKQLYDLTLTAGSMNISGVIKASNNIIFDTANVYLVGNTEVHAGHAIYRTAGDAGVQHPHFHAKASDLTLKIQADGENVTLHHIGDAVGAGYYPFGSFVVEATGITIADGAVFNVTGDRTYTATSGTLTGLVTDHLQGAGVTTIKTVGDVLLPTIGDTTAIGGLDAHDVSGTLTLGGNITSADLVHLPANTTFGASRTITSNSATNGIIIEAANLNATGTLSLLGKTTFPNATTIATPDFIYFNGVVTGKDALTFTTPIRISGDTTISTAGVLTVGGAQSAAGQKYNLSLSSSVQGNALTSSSNIQKLTLSFPGDITYLPAWLSDGLEVESTTMGKIIVSDNITKDAGLWLKGHTELRHGGAATFRNTTSGPIYFGGKLYWQNGVVAHDLTITQNAQGEFITFNLERATNPSTNITVNGDVHFSGVFNTPGDLVLNGASTLIADTEFDANSITAGTIDGNYNLMIKEVVGFTQNGPIGATTRLKSLTWDIDNTATDISQNVSAETVKFWIPDTNFMWGGKVTADRLILIPETGGRGFSVEASTGQAKTPFNFKVDKLSKSNLFSFKRLDIGDASNRETVHLQGALYFKNIPTYLYGNVIPYGEGFMVMADGQLIHFVGTLQQSPEQRALLSMIQKNVEESNISPIEGIMAQLKTHTAPLVEVPEEDIGRYIDISNVHIRATQDFSSSSVDGEEEKKDDEE